ncbi:MAG: hypothetical protein ACKPKO_41625, partial [Candidatus Fonsibacter sp.]
LTKLDRSDNFMTASEAHYGACGKDCVEDGCLANSMVANKICMLMWSTDKLHEDMWLDHLSTMEQRAHEHPVCAAKGHMQYKWCRSNLKDQELFNKDRMMLNAQGAVEDGKLCDALIG